MMAGGAAELRRGPSAEEREVAYVAYRSCLAATPPKRFPCDAPPPFRCVHACGTLTSARVPSPSLECTNAPPPKSAARFLRLNIRP